MKKHILLYSIIGFLFCCSCDNFLDKQPRGNAIAETTEHYNGLFNDVTFMNLSLGVAYYSYWKSDEIIFTPDCYTYLAGFASYPQSITNAFQYQEKVYRDDENCQEWAGCYKNIYTYNVIANGVLDATGDELQKKHLYAEARVSRAYLHFLLAQWFAVPYNESTAATDLAVPIVTEANSQTSQFERATVKELYQFVTTEMEAACPDLEERNEHKMRIYKATGYTMLGKVYWMMGKYDQAIAPLKTAKAIIENDPTTYFYDYNEEQAPYGYDELSMENLDALIPYKFRSHEVLFNKQNALMLSFYAQYYDQIVPFIKPEFYQLFDEYDLRRNQIITKNAEGNPLPYPSAVFPGSRINYGVELPELYLMLAESEARAGSEDNARHLLEALREKRMLTGHAAIPADVVTKEDLIRFCVDEQTREYIGSGYRWYNIRRLWNDPLFQDMKPITHSDGSGTYTLKESQLKMEIPETVLMWNENWRE